MLISSACTAFQALYGNLFDWLIARINETLFTNLKTKHIVGVLDIFGKRDGSSHARLRLHT